MTTAGATYFLSLLCTTTCMMNLIENPEFIEINGVCHDGHFGHVAEKNGITYDFRGYKTGHHLDRKATAEEVVREVTSMAPAMVWMAPPVRAPKPPDLYESPGQFRNRQRNQRRILEMGKILAGAGVEQLAHGRDFCWEWPLSARYGVDCAGVRDLHQAAALHGRKLYDLVVDGCCDHEDKIAHGKRWRVLTSCPNMAASLRRCRCPGHKEHPDDPGPVRLPRRAAEAAMEGCRWNLLGGGRDLQDDVYRYATGAESEAGHEHVFALSRDGTALPAERPSGRRLAQVKDLMMRIHRASGHSSFSNLAKMLERRGSPPWAVDLANSLTCSECLEARRPTGAPTASLDEPASLWEVLGMDVFEWEYRQGDQSRKCKALLMIDRASRYVAVYVLHDYPSEESWEPTTANIKEALVRGWLAHNPAPKWLMTDAALYFTSRDMVEFAGRSGMGLLTAPAEAHWLLGIEERAIQTIKRTADRIEKEDLNLKVAEIWALACHGHNSHVHASTGYSPFQWSRGWDREDSIPIGLDPKRAFARNLLLRAKAEAAATRADAAEKLSRLNNTVRREAAEYRPGSLIMLWRLRAKNGRGGWTGPPSCASSGRQHTLAGNGLDDGEGQDEPGAAMHRSRNSCGGVAGRCGSASTFFFVDIKGSTSWTPPRRHLDLT